MDWNMAAALTASTAALIAVAAVVVIFPAYTRELDQARKSARAGSILASTEAGTIEYAETSSGAPLLSIHGAGGGFDQGLANVGGLVGEGFRIIAPSRFGYLGTPVPQDASPAAQADAHAALLSTLNVSRAVVIGVSAGARSAVELALRHPEKVAALILLVPGLYSPDSPVAVETSRGSQFAFWIVNTGGDFIWWAATKMAPSMLIRFLGVDPAVVAAASEAEQSRVKSIVASVQPLSRRFAGINIDSSSDLHELPLERITAPALIISARDDLFNTRPAAEHAAAKMPSARLVVYDHGGHLLVGHQEGVAKEVRAFLASKGLYATHS